MRYSGSKIGSLLVAMLSFLASAGQVKAEDIGRIDTSGFDQAVNKAFVPVSDAISSIIFYSIDLSVAGQSTSLPLILVWLIAASVFYTLYLGFINFRGLRHSRQVLRGDFDNETDDGHISRFEVLSTELSGTVGLGNIAGVAVAISLGGPGATLWMIIAALFGMSTKFAEAALGVRFRIKTEDGRFQGGPMYYLKNGLSEIGWPKLGTILSVLFALFCVVGSLGAGNMFQSNQAYAALVSVTGGEFSFWANKGWLFGSIMALLVGVVIIGGIRRIARVAEIVVPFMGGIYVLAALTVILLNIGAVPDAFVTIFKSGMTLEAGFGGLVGAIIMGIQRAAFSNEAGIGTAGIAHAPTKTNQAVSEGFIGMLGPVIDTVIICTMTALVIIISGVYEFGQGIEGVELTKRAFEANISWFPYVLAVAVNLFAFSTMLAWSYYGSKSFSFLFGERRDVELVYRILFCLFLIPGAMAELGPVIAFTDALIFAMAIPNIIGLYFLAPILKRELKEYWEKVTA